VSLAQTRRFDMRHPTPTALIVCALFSLCPASQAATCNVPSAPHPTIQSAVDDGTCTEINVAAGTFAEAPVIARTLSLQGAGSGQTFIQGRVEVAAGAVQFTGLHISAGGEALLAHSGGEVAGFDLEVVSGLVETPLFADGFEDGTTDAWVVVSP